MLTISRQFSVHLTSIRTYSKNYNMLFLIGHYFTSAFEELADKIFLHCVIFSVVMEQSFTKCVFVCEFYSSEIFVNLSLPYQTAIFFTKS